MRRSLVSGLAACLVVLASCGGPAATAETPASTPGAATAAGPDAARGERLFAELGCKGCHGSRTDPGDVGPNLYVLAWSPTADAAARATIRQGRTGHSPPMPAYGDEVSDAQLADLLAFLHAE